MQPHITLVSTSASATVIQTLKFSSSFWSDSILVWFRTLTTFNSSILQIKPSFDWLCAKSNQKKLNETKIHVAYFNATINIRKPTKAHRCKASTLN